MSLPYAIGFYFFDMIIIAVLYQLIYTTINKTLSKDKKNINFKVFVVTFGIFLIAENLRNILSFMGIMLVFVELLILTKFNSRSKN